MEFRQMRRKRQEMTREESEEILRRGTSGVLALSDDGGYPTAVPISYVFDGDRIFFHGAKHGHQGDALKRDPRASFCVIGQDDVIGEALTTCFRSLIVFERLRMLEGTKRSARPVKSSGTDTRRKETGILPGRSKRALSVSGCLSLRSGI